MFRRHGRSSGLSPRGVDAATWAPQTGLLNIYSLRIGTSWATPTVQVARVRVDRSGLLLRPHSRPRSDGPWAEDAGACPAGDFSSASDLPPPPPALPARGEVKKSRISSLPPNMLFPSESGCDAGRRRRALVLRPRLPLQPPNHSTEDYHRMADDDPGGRSGPRPLTQQITGPVLMCAGPMNPQLYLVSRPAQIRSGRRGSSLVAPSCTGGAVH